MKRKHFKLNQKYNITAIGSLSPLGENHDEIWKNYLLPQTFITYNSNLNALTGSINNKNQIQNFKKENPKYRHLDLSTINAIKSSRQIQSKINDYTNIGVNIGSSRGATSLFEKHFEQFLKNKNISAHTSPTTTLGNISSWIAQDLQIKGFSMSHSITCSTSFHAIFNAIAWLQAGMETSFIAGGSEAPLTPFTIQQMKAIGIYSKRTKEPFPCIANDIDKTENTMVLGEGTAIFLIDKKNNPNSVKIKGIGYAVESIKHSVHLSSDAYCMKQAMLMAIDGFKKDVVDIIITHSPGTKQGDISEYKAIKQIFGDNIPSLTNNKWKIGHTLGASAALSLEMGVLMLQNQTFIPIPYLDCKTPHKIQNILINSVGFGGNATSILIGI